MHRRHEYTAAEDPAWVVEMTALSHGMIDTGLRAGLRAMRSTPGLATDPWAEHDVLALALRTALTYGIPLSATVEDVLDRLTAISDEGGCCAAK